MAAELQPGDVVYLKKAHPCGSHRWRVTRLGADIGLTCLGCGRHLMLPRAALVRRRHPSPPAPTE